MQTSTPKPEPDWREETQQAPGNKLTLDNLAEAPGFFIFSCLLTSFYNMDSSLTQALKLKQTVEEGWVHGETLLEK